MEQIVNFEVKPDHAVIWFLGQAGYIIKSCGKILAIDPYLSDSVGKAMPDFSRGYPVPLPPIELKVDIFIVTHDHLDHLDPETIQGYRHKEETVFVGPRFACKKLSSLGISEANIRKIDVGEKEVISGVTVSGIYAVPTEIQVADTTGYRIEFPNGRNLYHSADTGYSELLLGAVPKAELFLVCINDKWGNLNISEAVRLTGRVAPATVIPNHYDLMRLNSENPETFQAMVKKTIPEIRVKILKVMKPFVW